MVSNDSLVEVIVYAMHCLGFLIAFDSAVCVRE